MLCDGVDPNRNMSSIVGFSSSSDLADCQSKCHANGDGCNVVIFNATTGGC